MNMEHRIAKCNFNSLSFNKLKAVLAEYRADFLTEIDEAGIYYLTYPPRAGNEQPELFAALVGRNGKVYLYLPALSTYAQSPGFIPQGLKRYLDPAGAYLCFPGSIADCEEELRSLLTLSRQMREAADPVPG